MKKLLFFVTAMSSIMTLKAQFTPCSVATVTYAGQTYNTVLIGGNQCWLHENLSVGIEIADVTLQSNNSVIEKSCYNGASSDCATYGGLYSWDEAMNYSTGSQGICPSGWHIPTQAEWQALISYLGSSNAGQKMKATTSDVTPWDGMNTSGFEALSGGIGQSTAFLYQGSRETFWSSTSFSSSDAYDYDLNTGINTLDEYTNVKVGGYCIRCIQNTTTGVYSPTGAMNYFSLFPNPASDNCEVALDLNSEAVVKLSVYNLLGEQVMSIYEDSHFSIGEHKFNVNTADLVNGIYFINLTVDGKATVKKLIKIN